MAVYRWVACLHPGRARDLACPRAAGSIGTPSAASGAQPLHRPSRQALRATAGGRRRAAPWGWDTRVEPLRRRSSGNGVINTADIERRNATFRERLASWTRRGRALARRTLTCQAGCLGAGRSRPATHRPRVSPTPVAPRRRRWQRVSRTTVGPSGYCCDCMGPRSAGPRSSSVGAARVHCNACLRDGGHHDHGLL
jgi:hypothetical protein